VQMGHSSGGSSRAANWVPQAVQMKCSIAGGCYGGADGKRDGGARTRACSRAPGHTGDVAGC